jgi:hypothetical protein
MEIMMKKIFMVLMLVATSFAWAGNTSDAVRDAGFSKLSEAEKAEVIKMVADKASSKDIGSIAVPSEDKVEKWVKIGSNIGQGLAGAAKEVGVAVNDFSKTTVGQLTMALIVWHMVGGTLIHVFGAVMIWTIGFFFIHYMHRRSYPVSYTYNVEKTNVFGNHPKTAEKRIAMDDENAAGWLFACGLVLVAGLVALFTF